MEIINKFNEREIELLNNIGIKIEDRDYKWEEIEDIKEDVVFKGEISNMDKNQNQTSLSMEYSNLADKIIGFEDEEHYCPLRNKMIDDGDCFETVMAISGLHAKSYREKLFKEYPECEKICMNCKHNKEK